MRATLSPGRLVAFSNANHELLLTFENARVDCRGPGSVTPSGRHYTFWSTPVDPRDLAALQESIGRAPDLFRVDESSGLLIRFEHVTITVGFAFDYESYEVTLARQEKYIGLPGGGLAHFPALPH
jgi:hypothetical protein